MEYRGYLIAKFPTGQANPWAYGRVGYGITGWTHTEVEAKAAVDRDIEYCETGKIQPAALCPHGVNRRYIDCGACQDY